MQATPIIAPDDVHIIKIGGICGLYRVRLGLEQTGKKQIRTALACRRQHRRQLDQRTREYVGDDAARRPQHGGNALQLDGRGDAIAEGILMRGEQRLRIEIYGGDAESVYTTVWGGRQGQMPSWEGRLSPLHRKILALYLYDLRRGQR